MFVRGLLLLMFMLTSEAFANAKMPFVLHQMSPVPGRYSSAEHPGAIFVIEAYFNGCGYCHQNAPQVKALAARYARNPRVQILDVSVDKKPSEYAAWVRTTRPNHPVLNDNRRMLLWGELGARGFPTTYVINSYGQVLWTHTGVWEGLGEVSRVIDQAL